MLIRSCIKMLCTLDALLRHAETLQKKIKAKRSGSQHKICKRRIE